MTKIPSLKKTILVPNSFTVGHFNLIRLNSSIHESQTQTNARPRELLRPLCCILLSYLTILYFKVNIIQF